jgi:cell division protein FtsQ
MMRTAIRKNTPATEPSMPLDVRVMLGATRALLIAALLSMTLTLILWFAARPVFALQSIHVTGDVSRNNEVTLRANALHQLTGGFFSMDLQKARQVFESVPWVRAAVVKRVWPDQIGITLEEHVPIAYWGEDKLLNNYGEIFEANTDDLDEELPHFEGPETSAKDALNLYQRLNRAFQPMKLEVSQLKLQTRGNWQVQLGKGTRIELGRGTPDEVMARVQRLLATLPQVTARYGSEVESLDLRYADGYALKLKGIRTDSPSMK